MGKVLELLAHTAHARKPAVEPEPEQVVVPIDLAQVISELGAIRQVLSKVDEDRARLEQIETSVAEALTIARAPKPEPPAKPEPHPRYDAALSAIEDRLAELDKAIGTDQMETRVKAMIEAVRTQAENRHKQTQTAIAAVAAKILPPPALPAPPVYRMRVVAKDVNNRPTEMLLEPVKP